MTCTCASLHAVLNLLFQFGIFKLAGHEACSHIGHERHPLLKGRSTMRSRCHPLDLKKNTKSWLSQDQSLKAPVHMVKACHVESCDLNHALMHTLQRRRLGHFCATLPLCFPTQTMNFCESCKRFLAYATIRLFYATLRLFYATSTLATFPKVASETS